MTDLYGFGGVGLAIGDSKKCVELKGEEIGAGEAHCSFSKIHTQSEES